MRGGNHSDRTDRAPAWAVGLLIALIVFGLGWTAWALWFA